MTWKRDRILKYRKAAPPRENAAPVSSAAPAVSNRLQVGIWDLDVSAGALPRLLDQIEECQARFSFNCIEAPYQTGLTLPGARTAVDWFARTGSKMDPETARLNVSARSIFSAAKPVLKDLPIDWLVVVVKHMISDTMGRECWQNLFATSSGNVVLISTFELREFAAQAEKSFEAAVMGVALSALLAAMIPDIEYQQEPTGSIFDFCQNRADIVMSIRDPKIDPENRARIPPDLLEPVERILGALAAYQGGEALKKVRSVRKKSRPKSGQAGASEKKTYADAAASFSAALADLNATLKKRAPMAAGKKHVRRK